MTTLLLNDTSKYHHGCEKVVEAIDNLYGFDLSIETTDKTTDFDQIDYSKFDLVILNGEGTMHHNSIRAQEYLHALNLAQRAGCKTYMLNTVWQNMKNDFDHIIQKCDLVTVREIYSQQEIKRHGVDAIVTPDLSYTVDVPYKQFPHVKVYEGQYFFRKQKAIDEYPRIDIFKQSWDDIVNMLRHSDLLITGRHHEMYAACKANCRFVVRSGNTWKNEGLFASAGVDIPYDIEGALSGKYDDQYEKLWKYLDESSRSR